MRRVSGWRGMCVWLAVAILLVAAASAEAGQLRLGEVVKRVIPQLGQQLSRVAVDGKVAVTAVCVMAACAINFTSPAEVVAAEESPGINFSHSVGIGVYHESGENIGTLRFGARAEVGSFRAYLTTAFRGDHRTTKGIDNIGVKTRGFGGARMLLFDYGEGDMSYGYLNADVFVGGTRVHFRNAHSYLLHYHKGPVQIAGLGYEYVDNNLDALNKPDESGDPVRSHGVALYRAGINYPLTDLLATREVLAIDLKLNSAMHLGDIGPAKLGETWQGELNDWVGDDADLDHLLYHTAGGSIRVSLADGRIKLNFGGAVQHTIDGNIQRPGGEEGDFDIINTTLAVGGEADILPAHGISLRARFERFDQSVEADLDGNSYDHDASGTRLRAVMRKSF